MYRPSKLAALLGLLAVAAAAAIVPQDDIAADAPLNVTTTLTDGDVSILSSCHIHYEVYEQDGCYNGASSGICAPKLGECRNLRGMGSASITVGNNEYDSATVIGFSDYDCKTEIQRVTLRKGTATCLRYTPQFFSIMAQR
ncbi:hypothetical protein BGZ95_004556 [Linnemannia exigua]|uniref:Uncharacterized protein n=1 Tax=Linnemannia exigua TaxID=604196 RepID=A0AAD4DHF4_9FUNG|nr:hypothetical protein BGZ95_004556 [Linnemannia exigua]